MYQTAVINVVGLSETVLGAHTPHLTRFRDANGLTPLTPVLPAVTCSVQSSILTGAVPGGADGHGIVGNGWYDRNLGEVMFWKQSNRLVRAEKIWETARRRDPAFTCANMFWWYNMHTSADVAVTPRPQYKADGRKIPDIYTTPSDLRRNLQDRFGQFPLFKFWGPAAGIESSQWIARASMHVHERFDPTLTLIYLPHLDYDLQRWGPDDPRIRTAAREIDSVVGAMMAHFESRAVRVIVLSEYGIEPVTDAVHINRRLREAGWLAARTEDGLELLDPVASQAFAVTDHQIAHVYVAQPDDVPQVRSLCESIDGVEHALEPAGQMEAGIDHERSGDLVLIADTGRWFSYDYWLDDARAPDFARTVEIHRKPGYDPVELFLDPRIRWPRLSIGWRLLKRKLGLRQLMDVIPLDASLVRGSHGRVETAPEYRPVLMSSHRAACEQPIPCTAVRDAILDHVFD